MSQTEKIHLNFRDDNEIIQLKVKIEQKLKKAFGFYCNKYIKKPREIVRFFHNKKELFENDSAKSANLAEFDIIDVVVVENLHSKYTHLYYSEYKKKQCVCVVFVSRLSYRILLCLVMKFNAIVVVSFNSILMKLHFDVASDRQFIFNLQIK